MTKKPAILTLASAKASSGIFNIEYMEEEEKARIYMPDCTKVYTVISEVEPEMYDRDKLAFKEGWEKTHIFTMFYPQYVASISVLKLISQTDKDKENTHTKMVLC